MLRLWTIQHADAWTAANVRGVLRADGRRVWRDFRPAYAWLREQIRRRVPGASGRAPIWAWAQPKPDLRHGGHLPPGTPGVRIEFVAPAELVLLSDFDAWHMVLNRGYLALTATEDDAWVASVGGPRRFEELTAAEQAAMRASWDRIFDLEALRASPYWHGGRADRQAVQATIEAVPVEWVVSARPFVAR